MRAALLLAASVLVPADAVSQAPRPRAAAEAWVGAEAFPRIWSLYAGTTVALFDHLDADGLRVRAVAGHGDYRSGTVSFADLLLGYHKQIGSLTIKVFAGLALASHDAENPFSSLDGTGAGAKGVLETWWNVNEHIWLGTDLAYGSLHDSYLVRVRLGHRFTPHFSLGLEGGAAGSLDTDIVRAGGFLRYEWASGEVSVSAGLAREGFDFLWDDTTGAYATVSVLTRF